MNSSDTIDHLKKRHKRLWLTYGNTCLFSKNLLILLWLQQRTNFITACGYPCVLFLQFSFELATMKRWLMILLDGGYPPTGGSNYGGIS
jgi:hypothetical protein